LNLVVDFFQQSRKTRQAFSLCFSKIIIIAKLSMIFFLFFQCNNQDNELIAELVLNFLFSKKIKDKFFVFSVAAIIRWGLAIFHKSVYRR